MTLNLTKPKRLRIGKSISTRSRNLNTVLGHRPALRRDLIVLESDEYAVARGTVAGSSFSVTAIKRETQAGLTAMMGSHHVLIDSAMIFPTFSTALRRCLSAR